MTLRVAELETLFTADLTPFEKGAKQVDQRRQALAKGDTTVKVGAEVRSAVADLDRVLAEADGVGKLDPTVLVDADAAAALGDLSKVATEARSLPDGEMQVSADTSSASGALDDLSSEAKDGASKAGAEAGSNLAGGVIAALATIPVAGAIVGIGAAIGHELVSGLQNEVRGDRLLAQTDLTEEQAAIIGRAAGEAYAGNFGESIASNMDAARIAIQSGLLDPAATKQATEEVISQLVGVADLLGEDVPRTARSAAQAIKTGMAVDAAGAVDLLVRAQKSGLNVSEDLLDTVDEYGTQFRKLGLEGPQAFGLIAQAVRAGARDTDIGADALKEFAIRAVDGSKLTADSFAAVGLSVSDMSAKIAAGGPAAAEALDLTLDRLRAVEDPATRAQIAVGLFGTQAEDMGGALYAMDLSTAVDQLGQVEGAADRALTTLGDNGAGKVAEAQRNIEVAADGIKGALASAFAPQIEGFATFVTENRTAVVQTLLAVSNGMIDVGRAGVNGITAMIETGGEFVAGPLADMVDGVAALLNGLDNIPGVDTGDAEASMRDLAEDMRDADEAASDVADTIRTNLVENTLDPAQEKLNEFGEGFLVDARLHDATTQLAGAIDGVGYAADGSALAMDGLILSSDGSVSAVGDLDGQLRAARAALDEQAQAAFAAGENQASLTQRYQAGRDALVNQLVQMGVAQTQAEALADSYGLVPGNVDTMFTANTSTAQAQVDGFITNNSGRRIKVYVDAAGGNPVYSTDPTNRTVMRFEANGDLLTPGLTPMSGSIAQIVPPNTWRVIGDRARGDELFAPLDGSARSHALMAEGARRMGGRYMPLADGAVLGSGQGLVGSVVAQMSDRQVERLARAFETGAARVTEAALAQQRRDLAGTRGGR